MIMCCGILSPPRTRYFDWRLSWWLRIFRSPMKCVHRVHASCHPTTSSQTEATSPSTYSALLVRTLARSYVSNLCSFWAVQASANHSQNPFTPHHATPVWYVFWSFSFSLMTRDLDRWSYRINILRARRPDSVNAHLETLSQCFPRLICSSSLLSQPLWSHGRYVLGFRERKSHDRKSHRRSSLTSLALLPMFQRFM